jgi:hypothetical protein
LPRDAFLIRASGLVAGSEEDPFPVVELYAPLFKGVSSSGFLLLGNPTKIIPEEAMDAGIRLRLLTRADVEAMPDRSAMLQRYLKALWLIF